MRNKNRSKKNKNNRFWWQNRSKNFLCERQSILNLKWHWIYFALYENKWSAYTFVKETNIRKKPLLNWRTETMDFFIWGPCIQWQNPSVKFKLNAIFLQSYTIPIVESKYLELYLSFSATYPIKEWKMRLWILLPFIWIVL